MRKIIELFEFVDQIEMLDYKFKYHTKVDEFWISDMSESQILQSILKDRFPRQKIKILPKENLYLYNENLSSMFIEDKVGFEDIIIISKIDEILNEDIYRNIDDHLPFGPYHALIQESNQNLELSNSEFIDGPIIFYRTEYTSYVKKMTRELEKRIDCLLSNNRNKLKNAGYKIVEKQTDSLYQFILD